MFIGKSWGKLSNQREKHRFDLLNCNAVNVLDKNNEIKNPSCDDSWGDTHIKNWLETAVPDSQFSCLENKKSTQKCYRNDNNDVFCKLQQVQINFSKFRKIERGSTTPSKKWEQNFISTGLCVWYVCVCVCVCVCIIVCVFVVQGLTRRIML